MYQVIHWRVTKWFAQLLYNLHVLLLIFFFHSECSFATLTSVVMTIYQLPPLCPEHSQLIRDRTP